MKMRSVQEAFHNGLVIQRLLDRLKRLGIVIDPFYLFLEGTRDTTLPSVEGEFQVCQITSENLPLLTTLGSAVTIEKLQERLARGHICIALRHKGYVVAYTWADTTEINDSTYRTKLGENEVYLYDAFTRPEYRGQGLAPLMRVRCYETLRALGKSTFFSISDCFNTPAIRFKRKLNARFVRLCVSLRIGNRKLGVWTIKTYPRVQEK